MVGFEVTPEDRTDGEQSERRCRRLLKGLREHRQLSQRVLRLESIPSVGEILALSWALEVGEVDRFPSIARAVSYCGLTSAPTQFGRQRTTWADLQAAQPTSTDDPDRGRQTGAAP